MAAIALNGIIKPGQQVPQSNNRVVRFSGGKQSWYDDAQIKANPHIVFLFGDNERDKNRLGGPRSGNSGQASVAGPNDRVNSYGITTTFFDRNSVSLQEYKALLDKEFALLESYVKKGGAVVVPCGAGGRTSMGTNLANLGLVISDGSQADALKYLNEKIDALERSGKDGDIILDSGKQKALVSELFKESEKHRIEFNKNNRSKSKLEAKEKNAENFQSGRVLKIVDLGRKAPEIPVAIRGNYWATDRNIEAYAAKLGVSKESFIFISAMNSGNQAGNVGGYGHLDSALIEKQVSLAQCQIFQKLQSDPKLSELQALLPNAGDSADKYSDDSVRRIKGKFLELFVGQEEMANKYWDIVVKRKNQEEMRDANSFGNYKLEPLITALGQGERLPTIENNDSFYRVDCVINLNSVEDLQRGSHEGSHYATASIVFNPNNIFQISAIYQDSFGVPPKDNFLSTLEAGNNVEIGYTDQRQQNDGYNCGRYAILNCAQNQKLSNKQIQKIASLGRTAPDNEVDSSGAKRDSLKKDNESDSKAKKDSDNSRMAQIKLFYEHCLKEARKEDHIMMHLTEKPTVWTTQGGKVIKGQGGTTFVEYDPKQGLSMQDEILTKSRKLETDVDRGIGISPLMKIKGQDGYYMQIADNKNSFVVKVADRDNVNLIDRVGDEFYNIFAKELERQKNSGKTLNKGLVADILSSYRDGPPPSFGPTSHSALSSSTRAR